VIDYIKKGHKRREELTASPTRDFSKNLKKGKIKRAFMISLNASAVKGVIKLVNWFKAMRLMQLYISLLTYSE
jgi:hypothetical protein